MSEPPSPTVGTDRAISVVGADEQSEVDVDIDRWCRLARAVLESEAVDGELTLTFVTRDEIAALNGDHLGTLGATDVLSFPIDGRVTPGAGGGPAVPVLLGDVVVCPAVAREQAPAHAGTLDDELALLVVHGVLHVLGHDHDEPDEAARMRDAELEHLQALHWGGPPPPAFRQEHDS